MNPSDLTAIILCGGKGERLRPFTDNCPKPLVPVLEKPLLLHLIDYLKDQGIKKFILCVGYKAEMIRDFVSENFTDDSVEILISDAGDAPIATRLALASELFQGKALVCYGDTIANVDISGLCEFHCEKNNDTTVTVFPLKSSFGIVDVEDGMATGFREKPDLPYFINIGFFIISDRNAQNAGRFNDLSLWLDVQAQHKNLSAFLHKGKHLTVNTEKERQSAEIEIIDLYTL